MKGRNIMIYTIDGTTKKNLSGWNNKAELAMEWIFIRVALNRWLIMQNKNL
jgi:hypothetical protein